MASRSENGDLSETATCTHCVYPILGSDLVVFFHREVLQRACWRILVSNVHADESLARQRRSRDVLDEARRRLHRRKPTPRGSDDR